MSESTFILENKVVRITDLVNQIHSGKLRIPAFQRGFVWDQKKVQDLFFSIYEGLPIGSLLFWKTNNQNYKAKIDNETPFPDTAVSYPTIFVIDGVQRLSSIYGVLYNKLETFFPKKASCLVFDLTKKGFSNRSGIFPQYFHFVENSANKINYFQVSNLLSRDCFVDAQEKLFKANRKDLINNLLDLSDRFMNYQMPIVQIATDNISEVVDIFLKLNRNVKILKPKEAKNAMDWLTNHS